MDPGLGFSKAARHSFELLRRARELVERDGARGVPVLFGASRKSFLTLVDRDAEPADRLGRLDRRRGARRARGVQIVRVHDVRATRQALDMDVVLGTAPGHADRAIARGDAAEGGE